VTQAAILRGLRDRGTAGLVHEVMQPPTVAGIHDTLAHLLENLQNSETQLVCIMQQNRLVGLVDLENIGEFLRIQQALADH
jgi:cysteine sulfinate desulfinase/cysteine desulfurase-like protein